MARYLGGCELVDKGALTPRPVTIVDAGLRKDLDLRVISPVDQFGALPEKSIWPSVYRLLSQQIRQEGIHALFLDSITDPRAMQQVAQETGAAIGGTLYGDALSKPGGEADTYLKMLRHDVATLIAGMMKN